MPGIADQTHGSNCDVLIVGGGMAGIAAAISAGRAGATVILLDRSSALGGNATQAFVHTFCGLYLPPDPTGRLAYANPGFASRLAEWLLIQGGAAPAEIQGKVGVLPTRPHKLETLLRQACAGIARLGLVESAVLREVSTTEGERFAFAWERAGARFSGTARMLIDTSGDACAAAALGVPLNLSSPEELQHPTFIFKVTGANPDDLEGFRRLKLSGACHRAARSGRLPAGCDSVLVRPTGIAGEAFISLNLPKPEDEVYDPLDPSCMQRLEGLAQKWAEAVLELFRETPGWQACSVLQWPRRLGVRETRRIAGRYEMTAEDILEGKSFDDEVALSTWPIELWNRHTGADFRYPQRPCGIPLRSLVSTGQSRLGMAGRCMSATHEALGALRVMGTGMATGEAIGIAAALACRHGTDLCGIDPAEVRKARERINAEAGTQP